ncbi:Cell surface A33 antigen [Heterocephalus glaber]|uniref:Cell surface A33 antigen n=1 Tax=Heterocephalus glaber TaxID=10181 RepID=G5AQ43_HETGA|nr:Cell surface A33 antigen [Heterocephalus glaber]
MLPVLWMLCAVWVTTDAISVETPQDTLRAAQGKSVTLPCTYSTSAPDRDGFIQWDKLLRSHTSWRRRTNQQAMVMTTLTADTAVAHGGQWADTLRAAQGKSVTLPCTYSTSAPDRDGFIQWDKLLRSHTEKVVTWTFRTQAYLYGSLYENRVKMASNAEQSDASLTIEQLSMDDNGTYECSVSLMSDLGGNSKSRVRLLVLGSDSRAGPSWCPVLLGLQSSPLHAEVHERDAGEAAGFWGLWGGAAVPPSPPDCSIEGETVIGNNIQLTCLSAEGSPEPQYSWKSYDSERQERALRSPGLCLSDQSQCQFGRSAVDPGGLRPSFQHNMCKEPVQRKQGGDGCSPLCLAVQGWGAASGQSLLLKNISTEMSGYYTCFSSNEMGTSTCDITLTVRPPSMNVALYAGIAAGVVAALIIVGVAVYFCCFREKDAAAEDKKGAKPANLSPLLPLPRRDRAVYHKPQEQMQEFSREREEDHEDNDEDQRRPGHQSPSHSDQ